jgi:hypothetical protein
MTYVAGETMRTPIGDLVVDHAQPRCVVVQFRAARVFFSNGMSSALGKDVICVSA